MCFLMDNCLKNILSVLELVKVLWLDRNSVGVVVGESRTVRFLLSFFDELFLSFCLDCEDARTDTN